MASTTAATIVTGAYRLLGAISSEEAFAPQALMADGFRRLNMMMGSWALQAFTIPVIGLDVYPLIAGKGSSVNPYTFGPGGDLNAPRPTSVSGAGLLLNNALPDPVEIPRGLLTDDAYGNIRVKDLTSTLFTNAYYNLTYSGGLGSLYLWPVPTDMTNSLVIYWPEQLGLFTSQTASYDMPEGA